MDTNFNVDKYFNGELYIKGSLCLAIRFQFSSVLKLSGFSDRCSETIFHIILAWAIGV